MNVLTRARRGITNRAQAVQIVQTWQDHTERLPNTFENYVMEGLNQSPIVAALIYIRMGVFSEATFKWRDPLTGEFAPDTPDLELLRHPWPGGHTADLLSRMELDLSLAGNAFIHRTDEGFLQRLRPDWMQIVGSQSGTHKIGYVYSPHGQAGDPVILPLNEVGHYIDMPDPLKTWGGKSWLASAARDVNADVSASKYIDDFFNNSATPNMIVKATSEVSETQRTEIRELIDEEYTGPGNAFRTLIIEGGADIEVVGKDLRQVEFSQSRAAGETRLAAAAGVAPIVAGLREGLQSGTYSNYGQAVRKTIDWKIRPMWRNAANALEILLRKPPGMELWYDDRHIAALQQDAMDDADIKQKMAATMGALITAGFEPLDVAEAVESGNFKDLGHTGLFSVQLQPPGTTFTPAPTQGDAP